MKMLMGILALGCACAFGGETKEPLRSTHDEVPTVVAQKLDGCDFLLNKDFKKNAKYYLCLFSASWCGPCRREMPRLAKTYAETLKADPDIELIHFSRDQNDEKALAWAEEHDVKFPVVKPKGGNPLDLHSRGIPHLFIVKADGTLVEEGHPAKLFTEEKLRALKAGTFVRKEVSSATMQKACAANDVTKTGAAGTCRETIGDYTWSYSICNGEVTIIAEKDRGYPRYGCAVSPKPSGSITIPSILGGFKVTGIGPYAVSGCSNLTSVRIPSCVSSIGKMAFGENAKLMSFSVDESNAVYSSRNGLLCSKDGTVLISGVNGCVDIPHGVLSVCDSAFRGCSGLVELKIPASLSNMGRDFWWCRRLRSVSVDEKNKVYKSVNGLLLTKDGRTLVRGGVGNVRIPNGVEKVDSAAFVSCEELTSVSFPSSVKSIGSSAFQFCWGLRSVTIPDSVTVIEGATFFDCHGLVSVSIPEGVTRIGRCAFTGCSGLTSIKIPTSVKHIESGALSGCSGLLSIRMCGERPDAKDGIFRGCKRLSSIHVPADAKSWAGMKEWLGIPLVFDGTNALNDAKVEKPMTGKTAVAQKLEGCDFLLNKDFKKNAKYYLCLFSASWCGPCRHEMPRLAKTYAETLKADPDIELIHFSCDQNDEKALAWAKEQGVKFPVVKPKGGNPLNLKSRGIPHLFIVKADGTLVEEGHPAKLFCEEKLRALK